MFARERLPISTDYIGLPGEEVFLLWIFFGKAMRRNADLGCGVTACTGYIKAKKNGTISAPFALVICLVCLVKSP